MDPYHWPKQRPQQPRPTQPQPPSQSPRQQPQQPSLRTSSTPSFLSQPLMSTAFPTYAHSSHPAPPAPPPYQPIHHSQNVGDTMVPHPHSYQNVQNPLAVPIQHPLPQLPQLHHHSINSQTQSTQHPSNQPPLQIQHSRIPHSAHPPHLQPSQQQQQQQQPQSQHPQQHQQPQTQHQQQRQQQSQQPQHQQSQSQQQPQPQQQQQQPHPPSSSQQLPPQQHPQSQPSQPHHPSHHRSHLHPPPHQHQQPRSISIQPPPRQHSPPTLASPQSRALHSPHPRDVSSAQHISAQTPVNPQVMGQQLSHLNQTQQQQQLSQHSMQQTPTQQSQQHPQQPPAQPQQQQYRQHPPHHRQQSCEPARVVYDSSSVYRLSQPQQQYFNPYSTAQQHVQPQQLNHHTSMYSSMPIPSHEYQQQPGSVTIPQETTVRTLSSQRMPPIHQHPPQPPTQHQRQPQPHIPQQQQAPQHMQPAQRPHQKLVAPLQPQPMQMVQMSRTQGQQHQDGQPLHHAHQQPGDPLNRQPLPSAPPPQTHQLPHSQQPRHITQTQAGPPNSARPQVPERRPSPSHMHPPPPQNQVHMTSAPIPSTMQSHQHQMQRQVIGGQPMQPRDRQHAMQPLMSQKPKISHHSVIQQQVAQPGKMPQSQHLLQQSAQSNEPGMMSHHAGQQFQDAISKHLPQNPGALRPDAHATSVVGSERQPVKQEHVPEQSGGVRQLKVEDALAYLEQVKSQFSNNPGVYNHFLDIMKEFKANTINTAEVIRRVSSLFQGHRKLILGFNTFLPPGYKIELRSDPTTGCVTGFSSPGGVFCALTEAVPEAHPEGRHQPTPYTQHGEIGGQHSNIATATVEPSAQLVPSHARQGVSQTGDVRSQEQHPGIRPGFDHGGYHQPINVAEKDKQMVLVPQSQEGMSVSDDVKPQPMQQAPKDNAAAALAERFASPDQGVPVPGKRIEFEQAVTYVNKIKSRFADDQQAYQTFLGILQTYQKEQKSIKEVYKQVSHLFRDHEDLLREFSNFLPEQSPQAQRQVAGLTQKLTGDAVSGRSKAHVSQVKQQPVVDGTALDSSSPTYPGPKKEKSGKGPGRGRPSKPGSASLAAAGGISKPVTSGRQKLSVQEKKGRKSAGAGKKSGHEGKGALTHSSGHVGQLASSEGATPELEFFDELRSLLGPDGQQNYSEFIKCLSLFSQEIICGDELMRLADGLLSHRKPLTDGFRAFLDQSDPRATQTAVEILRRAKAPTEGLDRPGSSSRGAPAPPVVSTPAVRERLRDLPPLVGIGSGAATANVAGIRSPKLNPLYKGKPLSQIGRDFGTELAGTSSYMTLPADVVQIQCSGMTTEDRNVLNHMFVSKGDKTGQMLMDDDPARSGSAREDPERISSIPQGQNYNLGASLHPSAGPQHLKAVGAKGAECMNIDDQRLELEVMIARAETTSEKLEQLIKGEIRNLSTFTGVDFKPIELVYKDASFDVIDVLRTNPNVTAPVVLNRLRQRLTDWHTSRKKIERLWKSSRFTGSSGLKKGPRTWRRSELKEELICNRTNHDKTNYKTDRHSHAIDCDLVYEDENLSVICDILWYAFEWEAEDVETADKGLEFVERLYGVLQKANRKGIAMYVDEHLYVYIRLLAEVSQRVKYVLEHNYDGLTTQSLVQKVKDVLGGTVSLPAYDDHCRKLYGDSGEWTSFLSDFPLVCKRLVEAALAVPQMQTSSELLHHVEGSVHREESSALRDGDVVMKDTKAETSPKKAMPQETAESATQRLRSAMRIAGPSRDEIFEVKVLPKGIESLESSDNDPKDVNETMWILRMRHVPRKTASQFERLTQETDQEQPISSAVTKYIRRAMKRKRQHDLICGSECEKAVMYQNDGLDIRVDKGSGEKMYVGGTEDFFMKSTFIKRKAARLMLSESRKCKEVTVE